MADLAMNPTPDDAEFPRCVSGTGWDPVLYAAISREFQVKNAAEVIALYNWQGNEVVLDLGSGDGHVTATYLVSRVPQGRVIGLDNDPKMFAYAPDHYPPSRYPNLSFIEGDVCDIELALSRAVGMPAAFDVIVSNAVLHWLLEDPSQSDSRQLAALRGMNGRLASQGRVLLSMLGEGGLQELVDASLDVTRSPQWSQYFEGFQFPKFYSVDHYTELLELAGLRSIQVETVDRVMNLASPAALVGWYQVSMKSFMNRLAGLPPEVGLDFATQCVRKYAGPREEGTVPVVYRNLIVRATRGSPE